MSAFDGRGGYDGTTPVNTTVFVTFYGEKMISPMHRRIFLKWLPTAALPTASSSMAQTYEPFDFVMARSAFIDRIEKIRRSGALPIIDVESSYNPLEINLDSLTASMDRAGIALMCLSVDQPGKLVNQGQIWSDHAIDAYRKYPSHFIPTGNGGNHPAWTKFPERFLDAQENKLLEHRYPMMGEFEVRHYPSPRQIQRGELFRDVDFAMDGPLMERVFSLSEKYSIPFQIHYEIEDRLLDPLERMLTKFPKAKVIWCHLAQIRYQQRSSRYSPSMIGDWLEKYPNLYIDTAFADFMSTYQPSGERHARFWNNSKDWVELISSKPYRFLAALDIGGDRVNRVEEWTGTLRKFLGTLPQPTREIVAYKAAWRLLFNEVL